MASTGHLWIKEISDFWNYLPNYLYSDFYTFFAENRRFGVKGDVLGYPSPRGLGTQNGEKINKFSKIPSSITADPYFP